VAHALVGHAQHLARAIEPVLPEATRLHLAAALLRADCDVDSFVALLRASRGTFHDEHADVDDSAVALAVAVLLLKAGRDIIGPEDIQRVAKIYQRMRRRHWWQSVPADLPTSALLSDMPGEANAIEVRIESTYMSLIKHGLQQGTPLHLATALLSAAPDGAAHGHQRFLGIRQAFQHQGIQAHAGGMALLALLPHEPQHIVEQYRAIEACLISQIGLASDSYLDEVAAGLTYLDLAPFTSDGAPRHDHGGSDEALTLLMQSVICCWASPATAMETTRLDPDE
jgi:hypothetical protein